MASGIEAWMRQRNEDFLKQQELQKQKGSWTLQDWKNYVSRSGANRPRGASRAWNGGYLTPEDYSRVTYLQQEEAKNKLESSYNEAKTVNEERYADILKGYGDRYDTAMSSLQGLGDAEKTALENAYRISGSQQQQSLVNSGLASTTIRPAVMQQNEKQKQTALSGVNERLQREKIGLQTGLSGDTLAFKERREDTYPQLSYYMDLIKQFGSV